MSDAAATGGIASTSGGDASAALTDEAIESLLADFRAWLTELRELPPAEPAAGIDLATLAAQFTALRHEVNMQTRAVRAAVEQNAEIVKQVAPPEPADHLRGIAKAVVDIADALTLSLRQMEKFREAPAEPAARPGFIARVFGTSSSDSSRWRELAASAADGYALSLRRVERLLPELQLEPIPCVGEPFDPETMEAVEVVGDTGRPAGTVIEAVRPGYRRAGKVFRFAQVKVAR
jgi:molecular chaperone GrpE